MILVFDLDGTLLDSVEDVSRSTSEMVTSYGGRPLSSSEVATMVGDGAATLVTRALAAGGVTSRPPGALARYLEIYNRRLLDTTRPYEGIPEALIAASRRAALAVLTNKPLAPTIHLLEALGLSAYFRAAIGGDGPHGRKPDPAGLLALAKGFQTIVLVGDSPIDWQTAQAAGCSFVWARYGFGARRFNGQAPETPYVLNRPADLSGIIDRIGHVMPGR